MKRAKGPFKYETLLGAIGYRAVSPNMSNRKRRGLAQIPYDI